MGRVFYHAAIGLRMHTRTRARVLGLHDACYVRNCLKNAPPKPVHQRQPVSQASPSRRYCWLAWRRAHRRAASGTIERSWPRTLTVVYEFHGQSTGNAGAE